MDILTYIGIGLFVIFFGLSAWFNLFLLRRLLRVNENLSNILEIADEYSLHLEEVYNMERFYGDEVLSDLLKHSQSVGEELKIFIGQYEQTQEDPPAQK